MSTSEQYLRQLANDGPRDWGAAVRMVHAEFGGKAAGMLAGMIGRATRTGERWINKAEGKINPKTGRPSQSVTPPPMVQVEVVEFAKRLHAAKKLRNATNVNAGTVQVAYEGGLDPRPRHIGSLPVVGVLRDALDVAADLVMDGNFMEAAGRIDDGVLDAYGVPERTLTVEDYNEGFSID